MSNPFLFFPLSSSLVSFMTVMVVACLLTPPALTRDSSRGSRSSVGADRSWATAQRPASFV
ncbi:hypothetical protein LX32DRAFT_646919 [Colletotrichum zoysiae]|uniref:Uncharacterized protein n=1 Tax=Colletotrichum zoysiae TaxID=1216348 RepID=A0AAD9H2L6_9PEZI|nr:hypothetical protein LX32DRAFT_646919 [Colletotrichum zoysiae]